jgi:signal transduction histidine kinase
MLIIVSIFLASIISLYYYQKKLPNEKAVVKLLIFGPIIFIPTIISILIYSILTNNEQIYKENIQSIITTDTKNQKNMLRNEVEQLAKLSHIFKNKKEQLFEYINTTRYGNNGYFFALDTEGNVLANGDNKDLIGKNVYNLKGEDNIYFTKEIITNALSNNIEFIKYKWPYPLTSKLSTKYTYSKFLPQYNIIIASGIYDEDINFISYKKITELNEKNKKQVLQILWISFTIIITFTILAIILSNMVRKIFEKYNNEIDKKNLDLEKLNLSLEDRIHEEVKKNQEKDSLIFQQSKMVSMGEMIGNIAHQWRQPLSVISTGVTGMKLKKEYSSLEDEDFFKTCDIINENAQYLSKTIDDFKNYIKNERTKVDFIIKENIDNLMKIVEGTIKNNNITPILDIDETLQINGYPNELIQCMMNIVNNAKDALKEIKDERFIFITVKANNNNVEIIFKDNANGIPENIISKIFEPYFTTKHQSQGTGLGLSMTYSMITKGMNGSIDVKNTSYLYKEKKYKGAQFTITLPLNIEGEII